jgi:hypothetical protein
VSIPGTGGPPFRMGDAFDLAIDDECLYTGAISAGVYSVAKSYRGQMP